MKKQIQFYTITALTNLHAGSGDAEYGTIDKLVQRDELLQLPSVNSSSLKGALREFFHGNTPADDDFIVHVFGYEKSSLKNPAYPHYPKGRKGEFDFVYTGLLSLPVRSNSRPFYRATSVTILRELCELLQSLDKEAFAGTIALLQRVCNAFETATQSFVFDTLKNPAHNTEPLLELPDIRAKQYTPAAQEPSAADITALEQLTGQHTAIVPHHVLATLCNDLHLPVIARNCLENGISANLWYEQVCPRQTRFFTLVARPGSSNEKLHDKAALDWRTLNQQFDEWLGNCQPVQVGANATVGYGYCAFELQNN